MLIDHEAVKFSTVIPIALASEKEWVVSRKSPYSVSKINQATDRD